MKVLHISAIDRTIYSFRLPLLNQLSAEGLETWVACTQGEYFAQIGENGHKMVAVLLERQLKPFSNLKSLYRLVTLMRHNKFDLVHTHTPIAGAIGRMAATLAKVPKVFHTTGGWYFHEHMPVGKRTFYINMERFLARQTDVIFSVNREDITTAQKLNIRPRDKIVYSGPAGVDLTKYPIEKKQERRQEIRKELALQESDFVIGLVARHVWEKGIREFLDTAEIIYRQYPNTQFLMIGDGPSNRRNFPNHQTKIIAKTGACFG